MVTLSIPEATYRQLVSRAAAQNTTVEVLAERLLAEGSLHRSAAEQLIDEEYHSQCAADTSPVPTLEEVRAVMAKLPGSLAADLIADRDDR
jgi:hypothetical protein